MKVTVIGSGYVGLVAGACLAETGNDVICADVDARKVKRLQQNDVPIYEPGLEPLIARNQAEGRLRFTTDLGEAVRHGRVIFIAVGTPPDGEGQADLRQVLEVARTIGELMTEPKIVVTKSTVPVGTAERVRAAIRSGTEVRFEVASNPEFLKEGAAIEDFMKPDRVVLGVDSDEAREVMGALYAPFVRTGNPILFMDIPSAEVTKYAANAMLATRISFMNQIADFCDRVGADVNLVRQGIGTDRRIGSAFLFPGPGYGGSCFPKDVKAFITAARDAGQEPTLLDAVETVNERQKRLLPDRVVRRLGPSLVARRFAVWGLAFKAETDDMRESPAIPLVEGLLAAGGTVKAHDPKAIPVARGHFGDRIEYAGDPYDCLAGADALVVVTEWLVYRNPDFERIRGLLKAPIVFDGRNLYDPDSMRRLGFEYYGIGRGRTPSP
ncbi:MAG TPA: UDP-glucose/GDP-mannose dehydrogenase family protein [Gemmatimonadales bacterium]|nr:UDP-glucose/GDP-mannose dehydrogenase family protein [Gemmatimonadales bacterium]